MSRSSLRPFFAFFTMQAQPGLLLNGVVLQPRDIAFRTCNARFHQRITTDSRWGMLALAPRFTAVYSKTLAGQDDCLLAAGRVVRAPSANATRFLRLHARIGRLVETRPVSIGHPGVALALERELIHALITCRTAGEVQVESGSRRRHAEVMVRLKNAITAHPDRILPVSELAAMIGISERTLGIWCSEFLGVSPSRYLRLRHLNAVRKVLLHTDPMTARIRELARRHGFTELGRFSGAYREAFGERPSTTLRRVRNATDAVDFLNLHSAGRHRSEKVTD